MVYTKQHAIYSSHVVICVYALESLSGRLIITVFYDYTAFKNIFTPIVLKLIVKY